MEWVAEGGQGDIFMALKKDEDKVVCVKVLPLSE